MKKIFMKRKFVALVLMMTIVSGIIAYGATDTMTTISVDRRVTSVWTLSISETYMGNNMYTYNANEKEDNYRRFQVVKLKIVALCMGERNAITEVSDENLFEFSGSVTATPDLAPLGQGVCDFTANDSYFGNVTKRVTHN